MGNICGKTEKEDNFSTPGRVAGPSSTAASSAAVPKKKPGKVSGPGRTLGGPAGTDTDSNPDEARRRAAEAAEARAKVASKPGGKLQTQLAAQKKQTRNETLKEASEQGQRTRDADDAAKARQWD